MLRTESDYSRLKSEHADAAGALFEIGVARLLVWDFLRMADYFGTRFAAHVTASDFVHSVAFTRMVFELIGEHADAMLAQFRAIDPAVFEGVGRESADIEEPEQRMTRRERRRKGYLDSEELARCHGLPCFELAPVDSGELSSSSQSQPSMSDDCGSEECDSAAHSGGKALRRSRRIRLCRKKRRSEELWRQGHSAEAVKRIRSEEMRLRRRKRGDDALGEEAERRWLGDGEVAHYDDSDEAYVPPSERKQADKDRREAEGTRLQMRQSTRKLTPEPKKKKKKRVVRKKRKAAPNVGQSPSESESLRKRRKIGISSASLGVAELTGLFTPDASEPMMVALSARKGGELDGHSTDSPIPLFGSHFKEGDLIASSN